VAYAPAGTVSGIMINQTVNATIDNQLYATGAVQGLPFDLIQFVKCGLIRETVCVVAIWRYIVSTSFGCRGA